MNEKLSVVPVEQITRLIRVVREQKVIFDADLAQLYGVATKRLNEQVKRNTERFPEDFVFQLSKEEHAVLRSQSATSNSGRGGRRYLPYAFTEHGAIMAANVLNSQRAIEMSVFVVRAFVRLRRVLASHIELAKKLEELEQRVGEHDEAIRSLVAAIRQLMASPQSEERSAIGFGQGRIRHELPESAEMVTDCDHKHQAVHPEGENPI
ncbi:ORF6N domain-containing protein [Candidatus Bipolaricaulota bacterium]|nr:ORF6N domain-containing protein [Candidatus Bipolaricaulota bacterium]